MPQKVDAPVPPKTMVASKTGNASLAGGASPLDAAIDQADKAAGAALIIVAICAFICFDRPRELIEEHV